MELRTDAEKESLFISLGSSRFLHFWSSLENEARKWQTKKSRDDEQQKEKGKQSHRKKTMVFCSLCFTIRAKQWDRSTAFPLDVAKDRGTKKVGQQKHKMQKLKKPVTETQKHQKREISVENDRTVRYSLQDSNKETVRARS